MTGGAGFIGTNLAARLLSQGERVLIFDNLSRPGVERNLQWLRDTYGSLFQAEIADVRDRNAVRQAVRHARSVYHFAAQVAVTSSLNDPEEDFEINARGTLNLLESMRRLQNPPGMIFTSTNKVYGSLEDIELRPNEHRYEPENSYLREMGVSEARPLDFHSPYGCSKGAADQYVSDYARVFGLRTVVFRMSCIYGFHQFGTEDQGWVAHFLISSLRNDRITLYGDGMQVRDILFVEDLVNAFLLAGKHMDILAGDAFNIGGGPSNAISLRELLSHIRELNGGLPEIRFDGWRTGDQRYYVSNTEKFSALTGWKPKVDVRTGVEKLYDWLARNLPEIVSARAQSPLKLPELAVQGI
ncbi:MAG: NAD-dependent epimerase/dehydratase family protein [Candidatus Latescibacterota bacterium]